MLLHRPAGSTAAKLEAHAWVGCPGRAREREQLHAGGSYSCCPFFSGYRLLFQLLAGQAGVRSLVLGAPVLGPRSAVQKVPLFGPCHPAGVADSGISSSTACRGRWPLVFLGSQRPGQAGVSALSLRCHQLPAPTLPQEDPGPLHSCALALLS